jgi:hypothetical protein
MKFLVLFFMVIGLGLQAMAGECDPAKLVYSATIRHDYNVTSIGNSAFVQLDDGTNVTKNIRAISVFDSGGSSMTLARGASSEAFEYIHPGGYVDIHCVNIASGSSLSAKSASETVSSGVLEIGLYFDPSNQ